MTHAARKGWCPALLTPMQSGDGWLVRVKPTGARLAAHDARAIAKAAARYGNGHIDLTNRANLQVRGLRPQTLAPFASVVLARGLAAADPAVEQVRNVMASPLGGDDPSAAFDSHKAARAVEDILASEPRLRALPAKFGFLVDAGGALPLDGGSADIAFRPRHGQVLACLDGAELAGTCAVDAIAEAARRLALAFLALRADVPEPPRRMRGLVAALGAERILAAAGLAPTRAASAPARAGELVTSGAAEITSPHWGEVGPSRVATGRVRGIGTSNLLGWSPLTLSLSPQGRGDPHAGHGALSQGSIGFFGVGLPFGQIEAGALITLAGLAERRGDGTLRCTPWRVLLLPGVEGADTGTVAAAVRALGLITDRDDPRLAIVACVGGPACASASVATRADAARLAQAGLSGLSVHISGCAKGCAHPRAADVTLVGNGGRYDLVRGACASGAPALRGLSIEQAIAALRLAEKEAS